MRVDSNLKLIVPLDEFESTLIQKCKDKNPLDIKSDADLNNVRDTYNKWYDDILSYYKKSFNKADNDFTEGLIRSVSTLLSFYRQEESKSVEDVKYRYEKIQSQIVWDIRSIKACEMLYADDNTREELLHRTYTVDDKLQLILEKLYLLRSDRTFPIRKILVWNGVKIVRESEPVELTQQLQKKDLVTLTDWLGSEDSPCYARITSKGEQFVEKLKKVAKVNVKPAIDRNVNKKNVFIVHGHDKSTKLELKELLKDEFKLNPIILGEKPMTSLNTIFHKIDEHARDCVAAIVLMTPDDKVGQESRARENVLLELGYFIGLFPPNDRKVLILRKGDANIPSDIQGVERIDFKESIEEVHLKLKKQFKFWGLIK